MVTSTVGIDYDLRGSNDGGLRRKDPRIVTGHITTACKVAGQSEIADSVALSDLGIAGVGSFRKASLVGIAVVVGARSY